MLSKHLSNVLGCEFRRDTLDKQGARLQLAMLRYLYAVPLALNLLLVAMVADVELFKILLAGFNFFIGLFGIFRLLFGLGADNLTIQSLDCSGC